MQVQWPAKMTARAPGVAANSPNAADVGWPELPLAAPPPRVELLMLSHVMCRQRPGVRALSSCCWATARVQSLKHQKGPTFKRLGGQCQDVYLRLRWNCGESWIELAHELRRVPRLQLGIATHCKHVSLPCRIELPPEESVVVPTVLQWSQAGYTCHILALLRTDARFAGSTLLSHFAST